MVTKRALHGTHRVSFGVKVIDLWMCSIICGASVVSMVHAPLASRLPPQPEICLVAPKSGEKFERKDNLFVTNPGLEVYALFVTLKLWRLPYRALPYTCIAVSVAPIHAPLRACPHFHLWRTWCSCTRQGWGAAN